MTHARPMFPPRADSSRRNFLSQAAAVAAGSAVLAAAPALAIAAPKPVPDALKASPAFTAAVRALDEASNALDVARATIHADDQKVRQWKHANPAPTSKRGLKRWHRKMREYYRRDEWGINSAAQRMAERQFRAAQFAVAKIIPRDTNELMLMAAVAAVYDSQRLEIGESAVIGYQVALSYVRLHGAGIDFDTIDTVIGGAA